MLLEDEDPEFWRLVSAVAEHHGVTRTEYVRKMLDDSFLSTMIDDVAVTEILTALEERQAEQQFDGRHLPIQMQVSSEIVFAVYDFDDGTVEVKSGRRREARYLTPHEAAINVLHKAAKTSKVGIDGWHQWRIGSTGELLFSVKDMTGKEYLASIED